MSGTDDSSQNTIVSSTWEVLNNRKLRDALTLEASNVNSETKKNLDCMVSLETCVHLGAPNDSTPCQMEIDLKKENLQITEISIVSEARIIEIYGMCGEYLATSHAEFLDECEDMVVYVSYFKFSQPSLVCSLKFARMKDKMKMWLYGLHISTEKYLVSTESTVNFSNVNKILKESSLRLTEKADKCKKFLQMYNAYCVSDPSPNFKNPQTILKVLDSAYLNQCSSVSSQAKHVSKSISDYLPTLPSFAKDKFDTSQNKPTDSSENNIVRSEADILKYTLEELKQHVDRRFTELAVTLTCEVEKRLNNLQEQQNKKLDEIIHLLQNVKENRVG